MATKYPTKSPLTQPASSPVSILKKAKPATPLSSQVFYTKRKTTAGDVIEGMKMAKRTKRSADEEKRLRRFRARAPGTYLERLTRVRTQRMFLIDRKRSDEELEEVFNIAGSTGNVSDSRL